MSDFCNMVNTYLLVLLVRFILAGVTCKNNKAKKEKPCLDLETKQSRMPKRNNSEKSNVFTGS